jgi:hypothetical protein
MIDHFRNGQGAFQRFGFNPDFFHAGLDQLAV